jgi:hypothetical protein
MELPQRSTQQLRFTVHVINRVGYIFKAISETTFMHPIPKIFPTTPKVTHETIHMKEEKRAEPKRHSTSVYYQQS